MFSQFIHLNFGRYQVLELQNQRKVSKDILFSKHTVFPHIRPAGIIILYSLQIWVLLENTKFQLNRIVRIAGIIRGRALYEEIQ